MSYSGRNTIFNFRQPLVRHGLTEAIFADLNAHLAGKWITLVDGERATDGFERAFEKDGCAFFQQEQGGRPRAPACQR